MTGIIALALGYVFSQFFRSFLAVLDQTLASSLAMTDTQLAYASGAWFIAFALSQFPIGAFLDQYGPRRTAGVVFTVFCGSGALLFSFAWAPWVIIVAMALIGIGCSPALMAPMFIFVRNYSAERFAVLVSVFIGVGLLGNIASSIPLAVAVEWFGWRESAFVLALASTALGIVIFSVVKDPEIVRASDGKSGSFSQVLAIRELWPIFPMVLAGYVVAAGLRGSWIGPIHTELYSYTTIENGNAVFILSIALLVGTLMFGPLDRILQSRKKVVMGGNLVVTALCLWLCFQIPSNGLTMTLVISVIGMFGASYAVQMAHGKSFIPEHLTGRGVTFLNFCSIGGAGIGQWASGPAVTYFSVAGDSVSKFQTLFAFYVIVSLIAMIIYAFSKDATPDTKA